MKKSILIIMLILCLAIGASTITASADTVGEGWEILGYSAGWVLIAIALVGFGLGALKVLSAEVMKKVWVIFVALLLVGALLLVVNIPTAEPATTTTGKCPDFEITGSAITTGNYNPDTVWDEDTLTLTIPLTVSDSSDGNLTFGLAGVNLTWDPIGSGFTSEDITTIIFSSDYLMKYGGEYLLDEDSTGYKAIWTTSSGAEYYDDTIDVTADSTTWSRIDYTFVNGTAGSWVTELDAIGDSKTWYVSASNNCGTWSETITIIAMVISYTA